MYKLDTPRQNNLLNTLRLADFNSLHPFLERVELQLGNIIYKSGDVMRYAYFPTTCIVSLLYLLENGASTEVAMVGNDGIIGVPLFMGDGTMPNQAVVQSAGYAYRLKAAILLDLFHHPKHSRKGAMHDLLLLYTQALITQMAQTAVCNCHHTLEQRLCRWLLLSLDRLSSNELKVTQEFISNMLGVRREGVTEAARKLQNAGVITCRRGNILVKNRSALEERVCECYQVVKTEFDRLFLLAA